MPGRLPYAARVLIDQVNEVKPKTKADPYGELDGLGVWRTIKFSKAGSTWLSEHLEVDPRIVDAHLTDDGYMHVTFHPGPRSDSREPFAFTGD